MLRARGITAAIAEPAEQAAHRKRKGARAGRPVGDDVEDDKNRNAVDQFFNRMTHWRDLATRYAKDALVYHGSVVPTATPN